MTLDQQIAAFRELGMQVIDQQVDTRAFGNSLTILVSPVLKVRIIKDRSDIFIDITSNEHAAPWLGMRHIVTLLKNRQVGESDIPAGLDGKIAYIKQNYDAVAALFSRNNIRETEAQIRRLDDQERADFWRKYEK